MAKAKIHGIRGDLEYLRDSWNTWCGLSVAKLDREQLTNFSRRVTCRRCMNTWGAAEAPKVPHAELPDASARPACVGQ